MMISFEPVFSHILNENLLLNSTSKSIILENDPLSISMTESNKEFLEKLTEHIIDKQRLHTLRSKSKFKSYISVLEHDPLKSELLKEFLSTKILQYFDEINMVIIPDFKTLFETSIRISYFNESHNKKVESLKIGSINCNLDQLEHLESLSVCSWHWIISERENIFPFFRAHAICNCANCQAKTIYDTDHFRFSKCKQVFSIMPALVRETSQNDKINEKWWFALEEVPTSCVCTISVR